MMKKLMMLAAMAAATLPIMAATEVVDGITWTYTVSNGKASVGGGSSSSAAVPKSTSGAITIPSTLGGYPVTSIGSSAFSGCSGLTGVTIPDSVTSIGSSAFNGCSGLEEMTLPFVGARRGNSGSSDSLFGYIFGGSYYSGGTETCQYYYSSYLSSSYYIPSNLKKVVITDETVLGYGAFYNCSGLTSVTLPDSVTSIEDYAFCGCSGLTSVTIPDSVTSIWSGAFSGCSGLTSVTIPDSVTSIGSRAFSYCSCLTSFVVDSDNTSYSSANGLLLSKDGKTLVGGVNGDVTIPDSVTSIGSYAFSGYSGLTSVTIPDSVTSIGSSAFSSCSSLTSVTIPNGVTSIGEGVFCDCSGLTSVTIPDGVTSIGDYAFDRCYAISRVDYWCAPPANIWNASILYKGVQRYPREYGAQWQKIIGVNYFYGYLTTMPPKVEIVSSSIRENDPTIMDVVYKVTSSKPTVKVRALAFEDGERSFAKVVRPETFIEGTAVNIGDDVDANVEHTLSWQVSSDWQTRLAKLKFEVLVCEGELLPMEWMTIPASDTYGKMKVSWNAHNASQVFDALLWLYADKDPGLTLASGVLKNNSTQLASGTGTSNPNAIRYIYSKMGYDLLSGAALNYVNEETRLGLSPYGASQYAYKIVEDAQ